MIVQLIPSSLKYKNIAVIALEKNEYIVDGENQSSEVLEKRVLTKEDILFCPTCNGGTKLSKCVIYPEEKRWDREMNNDIWIICVHIVDGYDGNIIFKVRKKK